jgi:hypothetical protein
MLIVYAFYSLDRLALLRPFSKDSNRQLAWPLLLEHACKDASVHLKTQHEMQVCGVTSDILCSAAPSPEFSVKESNIKAPAVGSNERSDPSHIHTNPSSPSSVMDLFNDFDKDVSTVWLDVERWNPPEDHRCELSIPEYRNLLAHVILQSLQVHGNARPPLRYFQGFHILAGLVLNTYLCNTSNDLTTMSLATIDAIHFLQAWICNASILNDVVREDTIEPILQRLRLLVLPLYFHCRSTESPSKINDDLYDLRYDDEHNSRLIAKCLPWLLTMFGPHRSVQFADKATNLLHGAHARIVDAILASHPIYFPIYLCVTLLTSQTPNACEPSLASSYDVDFVIQKTIDRMKITPPQFLPQISARYCIPIDSMKSGSVLSIASQIGPIGSISQVPQYTHQPETPIFKWINLIAWTAIGFISQRLHFLYVHLSTAGHLITALIKLSHWKYISLRYPSAAVAMALRTHHGDFALLYRPFKRILRSIRRKAWVGNKYFSELFVTFWKSIKAHRYESPRQ